MLSSGRYVPPPPLPIDEGSGEDPGEDEEDPEDDVDLLVWFELGDVNDHEALSNRVARYVRPVAERVLAAMPHENTDLDRELELLRFVTRSIKQKLSGRSDTRIYTVLVEAIRLALFGVLSSYRTRSEVERTNLGKLRIALSTTLNSHFQTDSGARRKVQENG
jgi:hypothetical protein